MLYILYKVRTADDDVKQTRESQKYVKCLKRYSGESSPTVQQLRSEKWEIRIVTLEKKDVICKMLKKFHSLRHFAYKI